MLIRKLRDAFRYSSKVLFYIRGDDTQLSVMLGKNSVAQILERIDDRSLDIIFTILANKI